MQPRDKEELNQLLIDLKIKKSRKKTSLNYNNYNTKDYKNALKLINKYKNLDKNKKMDNNEIKMNIVNILKKEGLKCNNDDNIYKKDKDNINQLLINNGEKKSFNFQEKNRNIIKEVAKKIEIKELNMTLKELIVSFYNSNEFIPFKNEVEEIDKNFKIQKKNKYSLLE